MHLPLYFEGTQIRCLIIGGGVSVLRKIEIFLEAGATVTLYAPQADFKIVVLASLSRIRWEQKDIGIEDITDFDVVIIGAEEIPEKTDLVSELRKNRIPVNVCGNPEISSFYFPTIVREGEMTVAVSSGGNAPFMAVEFARRLKSAIRGWGSWLKLAARFKLVVEKSTKSPDRKKEYYSAFIQNGPVEISPLPSEKTSIPEWLQILKFSHKPATPPSPVPGNQPSGSPPLGRQTPSETPHVYPVMTPKPPRSTGFMPRSSYAAGYSAVENDYIPPPDEVPVLTHDAPDWEERYAAEPVNSYQTTEPGKVFRKELKRES